VVESGLTRFLRKILPLVGGDFFLKPVGLDLFRPIVTAYICCLFYSFGITLLTTSLICKMLVVLFNSFGEI